MARFLVRAARQSLLGSIQTLVTIAMATGPAEYTAGQQELPVRLMVNALECERVLPSNASISADYPKGLPFPTKRFATGVSQPLEPYERQKQQNFAGRSLSLPNYANWLAKRHRSYFLRGQPFGRNRPSFSVIRNLPRMLSTGTRVP